MVSAGAAERIGCSRQICNLFCTELKFAAQLYNVVCEGLVHLTFAKQRA